MKMTDFLTLCDQCAIDPAIALENEKIVTALKNRDDEEAERILKEEF